MILTQRSRKSVTTSGLLTLYFSSWLGRPHLVRPRDASILDTMFVFREEGKSESTHWVVLRSLPLLCG